MTIYTTDLDRIQYFRGTHNSMNTGPLRLHEATMKALAHADIYTLAIFSTARDVCDERAPVMYSSVCIRLRWCTRGKVTIDITDIQNIAQYFGGAHNSWKTGTFPIHKAAMIALAHADTL